MVEKHLTLRRSDGGPDGAFSMEPEAFARLVKNIRTLEKALGDAAAALTATLWLAAADTYFLRLPLAVGDSVCLTGDDGTERFSGTVHTLERTPQQVRLTALDGGVVLSRNEVHGLFAGSGGDICRNVAARLGLSVGTLEAAGAPRCIPALSGVNTSALLRQAAGEGREVTVEGGALTVRRRREEIFTLPTAQVREVSAVADIRRLWDHVTVVDAKGRAVAAARNEADQRTYGTFRKVLGKSGSDPQAQAENALRSRIRSAEVVVDGNLNYRCGARIAGRQPDWGLTGTYTVTAVCHRWEKGLFTTELTLEDET